MKSCKSTVFLTVLICSCIVSLMLFGCAFFQLSKPLKTNLSDASEIKGTVTLILYGKRFLDDMETVAILDIEGDRYTFKPFAPEFDYRVWKGAEAKEALKIAAEFISFHPCFWRSQLSRILDPNGKIIGYELRPLYHVYEYGKSDILDIYYWLKEDGTVKVTIRLNVETEKLELPFGGDNGSAGGD